MVLGLIVTFTSVTVPDSWDFEKFCFSSLYLREIPFFS
jgi:hypothetical protein